MNPVLLGLGLIYLGLGLARLALAFYVIPRIRSLKNFHEMNSRAMSSLSDDGFRVTILLELIFWPFMIPLNFYFMRGIVQQRREEMRAEEKKLRRQLQTNLETVADHWGFGGPPAGPDPSIHLGMPASFADLDLPSYTAPPVLAPLHGSHALQDLDSMLERGEITQAEHADMKEFYGRLKQHVEERVNEVKRSLQGPSDHA